MAEDGPVFPSSWAGSPFPTFTRPSTGPRAARQTSWQHGYDACLYLSYTSYTPPCCSWRPDQVLFWSKITRILHLMSTCTEAATVARPDMATSPPAAHLKQHNSQESIELQPTACHRRQQKQTAEQDAASPKTAEETPQSAPSAKVPYDKLIGCGFSFFFSGVNDGTLGPLIPYIQDTFSIGTGEIAIMCVAQPTRHRSPLYHIGEDDWGAIPTKT